MVISDYAMYVYDPANYFIGQEVATSLSRQVAGSTPVERTTSCVSGWNRLLLKRHAAALSTLRL